MDNLVFFIYSKKNEPMISTRSTTSKMKKIKVFLRTRPPSLQQKQVIALIEQALGNLSSTQREASCCVIGKVWTQPNRYCNGITEGSVKTHCSRAAHALAGILKKKRALRTAMTNEINPEKIVRLLTQSTRQLDTGTLSALSNAREQALKGKRCAHPVFTLVTGRWAHMLLPSRNHQWVSQDVACGHACRRWTSVFESRPGTANRRAYVAILTSDLPMEVFVD